MKHLLCFAFVCLLCAGCTHAAETPPFIELKGHEGGVSWASFFSDGKKVLTYSRDNTVRTWDAESGKELTKMEWQIVRDKSPSGMIRLSPDEKRVVTSSPWDRAFRIWDTESGEELYRLEGEFHGFLPNSNKIVVTSRNGSVMTSTQILGTQIVDAESGKELHKLEGYSQYLTASSDGKMIVTKTWDSASQTWVVHIWDVDSGKELRKFEVTGSSISYIYLSFDGKKMIVVGNRGPIHFFGVESGKELELEGYTDTHSYACFSPDGKKIVARSPFLEKSNSGLRFRDYSTRIWDAESGKELYKFENADVAFSQDGKNNDCYGKQGGEERPNFG